VNVRENLRVVARHLGPLLERAVFVGGATAELLITDRSSGPVRPTEDVDVVVPVSSRLEYLRDISEALRAAGFKPDMREGAPICRFIVDGVTVDVMPTDEEVLGFSNRWYPEAVAYATWIDLGQGLKARVLTSPYFLATKVEAFKGRGRGDYLASADVEDVIALVDGRPELLEEMQRATDTVRQYLALEIESWLAQEGFIDALEGYFRWDPASQARKTQVRTRLQALTMRR